jgi:molecular chaperone DnaK
MPQIEVSFDIDANGILQVKAKDKTSGKEQSIRIEASSGLTPEDIERMKKDAEAHSEEDRKKREAADARNNGESLAYAAEKALKDAAGKIPVEIETSVKASIEALRSAIAASDTEKIKSASDALSTEMQKIGTAMNQQSGPTESAPQNENPAPGSEAAQ